jgi:hypothetical protein
MSTTKSGRRRRSSSIIYQEPPESLEQISDQSALPNLNSQWVNAKGARYNTLPAEEHMKLTYFICRRLDNTPCHYPRTEDPLRHHPRRHARDIVDSDEHNVYGRLLPDVSLGPGRAIRV